MFIRKLLNSFYSSIYLCIILSMIIDSFEFKHIAKSSSILSNTYPHDDTCFTQGLAIYNNYIYESCGLYGKSCLRIVNIHTGETINQINLDRKYFAEGITIFNNKLYMLTWQNRLLFVYDIHTLQLLDTKQFHSYTGEGWGLTSNDKYLILSDGSERIQYYEIDEDNHNLIKIKDIIVRDPKTSKIIKSINELQYVNGDIYANVWYQDYILQINSENGIVKNRYDMSYLYPKRIRSKSADCLNGIAYNSTDDTFLLTGKLWNKYYKVSFHSDDHNRLHDHL